MKTFQTADTCEEAHARTVKECEKKNIVIDNPFFDGEQYTDEAQDIFNRHYDEVEHEFEAKGMRNENEVKKLIVSKQMLEIDVAESDCQDLANGIDMEWCFKTNQGEDIDIVLYNPDASDYKPTINNQ